MKGVILSWTMQVKRRYDTSRRDAVTRATKADVVAAAHELFVTQGYSSTTVAQIAQVSQTPPSTVYRLFGTKRGILKEVLDVSLGGDDQPVEFHQRPDVRAALAAGDPGAMLDAFAHIVGGVLHRSAALQVALAESAALDPEAAEMLQITRQQRLVGQSRIVRALANTRALRNDLRPAAAADIVYTLMSPEVFRCLTIERGWTEATYEQWLSQTLRSQLLT
jgi:AcrR family transcriptional regulator